MKSVGEPVVFMKVSRVLFLSLSLSLSLPGDIRRVVIATVHAITRIPRDADTLSITPRT